MPANRRPFPCRWWRILPCLIELHFLQSQSGVFGFPAGLGSYLCDPFVSALRELSLDDALGEPLLVCHVDLKNAFWSLRLAEEFRNPFRVSVDGEFGWQFSPALCQIVLGWGTCSKSFVWGQSLSCTTWMIFWWWVVEGPM